MKKVFVGFLIALGSIGVIFAITAARRAPTIRPKVNVGGIEVGGLTVEEAERKLRIWWEEEKKKPLSLHSDKLKGQLPDMRPSELGITLDDRASIAKLPLQDALADAKAVVTREEFPEQTFETQYKLNGEPNTHFLNLVKIAAGKPTPARVIVENGFIVRRPESPIDTLDETRLMDAVAKAIKENQAVELPIVEAPKAVPDEKLAQITETVSEFSTHFPKRQFNRNANLKLASSKLNGVVLMPGDQLSFNKTVGQRTLKNGFMLAGVYKNGKHDTGIGGGICQVSTTLYNASLFGNLKIVRRSNHSMPVAYVPLGRDATVDYGSLDLVIQNDYQTPIAITSEFKPGTLTFRILGKREPGQTVKIVQEGGKSWDRNVQVIHDPKLRAGATIVVDKGSRGHSIRTFRLVYRNGVLVHKQPLGFSFYGGGDKIIAVGPAAPALPTVPVLQGTKISNPTQPPASGG